MNSKFIIILILLALLFCYFKQKSSSNRLVKSNGILKGIISIDSNNCDVHDIRKYDNGFPMKNGVISTNDLIDLGY